MSGLRLAVVGTRGIPGVPGGVERHCEELYPRLAAAGVDVTLYAREPYVRSMQVWDGVRVVPLRSPRGKSTEALVHTVRAVCAAGRLAPDVLHCHSIGPAGVLPLARLQGLRTVLTVHAFDYLQSKWGAVASAYLRYGEWAGVRSADEVIAVARWMADDMASRTGRTVTYIPNGPLSIHRSNGDATIRELGLEPSSYVLFVGRLIPDKRVEDLIAASAIDPGLRVVVVGDTSHTDDYADRVRAAAGPNVVFAGYRVGRELEELYSHAGAFVLPSSVEGLPLSLMEAMSIGVPCVASDIPANREVLGAVGRTYPVGNVRALRAALDEALSLDAASRQAAGAVGQARVASEYDWDTIAELTLNVIVKAASR